MRTFRSKAGGVKRLPSVTTNDSITGDASASDRPGGCEQIVERDPSDEESQHVRLPAALKDRRALAWLGSIIAACHLVAVLVDSLSAFFGFDAWALAAVTATYGMRWGIHVHIGYLRLKTAAERKLALLTSLDLLTLLGMGALSYRALQAPSLGRATAFLGVLLVPVPVNAAITVRVLAHPDIRCGRGGDWVQGLPFVERLEAMLEPLAWTPGWGQLRFFVRWLPPMPLVSSYTIVIVTLAFAMLTSFATAIGIHSHHAKTSADTTSAAERFFNAAVLHPRTHLALRSGLPSQPADTSGADSYAKLCYGWPTPGDPLPQLQSAIPVAQRLMLRGRFEGAPSVAGDGARAAGCSWYAHRERQHPTVWWSSGWCGLQLRSIAIAWLGASAIMLQQVAVVARSLLARGLLLSASARIDAGGGDVQVLHTAYGDVLFIRQAKSAGPAAAAGPLGACSAPASINVPYVVLPPAMTVLWGRLVAVLRAWVWPIYDRTKVGRAFDFVDPASGASIASGSCAPNGNCLLTRRGDVYTMNPGPSARIDLHAVRRFAPPRP